MRRALPVLAGVLIVAAGLFGLLSLFNGRDSGSVTTDAASGPGVLETAPGDPPTSGEPGSESLEGEGDVSDRALVSALAAGNVALVYGTPKPPAELVAVQERTSGPFDPEIAAAGLSVVLVRRAGVDGVQALAWQRRLKADSPADPQLGQFVDVWLGRGRGNTD